MGDRVTNRQLADLIGGVDDNVVALGGKVVALENTVGELKRAVNEANGRQRSDHDRITALEERQSPLSVVGTAISTGISSGVALAAAWFFGGQKGA